MPITPITPITAQRQHGNGNNDDNDDNDTRGAISTVIVHKFPLPIQDIKTKAELDLSGNELNHLDAIIIAALLPLNVSRALFGYLYYR
jgi:hypothetical protein